jgi:hypothetical protein
MVCSCDKDGDCIPCQQETRAGTINVSLDFEDSPATRATSSYVTTQKYETSINDVQILVFDEKGALNAYVDADAQTGGISINSIYGEKEVWAVVNGPDVSAITTLSDLKKVTVNIGTNNSLTETKGFVMTGSTTCSLNAGTVTASIAVKRLVSRIALVKINNALPESYGSFNVLNATLINVVGNQNLECSATPSTWFNKMGRTDGSNSSAIIDGSSYLATLPDFTFKKIGQTVANGSSLAPSTPYLFYTFPNPTTTDKTGWTTSFSARKTRLVVTASVESTKYYYPITLDTPARNTAYSVELTITGLGATDPDKPVEKGAITATVTVDPWQQGEVYNATI